MSTTRLWNLMNARCVWATARFSSLRGSGMSALRGFAPEPIPRKVESGCRRARPPALPILRWQPVAVELRRPGIERPRAVERVQVEARRARLLDVDRRHIDALHHPGLVEREVVVDELTEVGEAGRDLSRRSGYRRSSPARSACGWAHRAALPGRRRAHAREAKLRVRRLERDRQGSRPAAECSRRASPRR